MTAPTVAMLAARLEARLREDARPDRAEQERAYLKSNLEFLGCTVWQIRTAVKEMLSGPAGELDHDRLVALADVLWREPMFERRMAAVVLLDRRSGLLSPADLPLIERFIRESLTWALVDGLAGDVVGAVLAAHAEAVGPTLARWSRDDDFWVRRSALLAWLRPLRLGAPLDPFLATADALLDEREFFIRKAIGWVLREVGKRRPAEVAAWLAPRTKRVSGVTIREAVKYLPATDATKLMTAYRERRAAAR